MGYTDSYESKEESRTINTEEIFPASREAVYDRPELGETRADTDSGNPSDAVRALLSNSSGCTITGCTDRQAEEGDQEIQEIIGKIDLLPTVEYLKRRSLPRLSGIYFLFCGSDLLYIGKSKNIQTRWISHPKIAYIVCPNDCKISWLEIPKDRLNQVERQLICHFTPILNQKFIQDEQDLTPYIGKVRATVKISIPTATERSNHGKMMAKARIERNRLIDRVCGELHNAVLRNSPEILEEAIFRDVAPILAELRALGWTPPAKPA